MVIILYIMTTPPATHVWFYSTRAIYEEFSNFFKSDFVLDGERYPTVEHYFQSKKFEGTLHEKEVRDAPTASRCAQMGRQRRRPLRNGWDHIKDEVMYKAVSAKFNQNKALKDLLLSTGELILCEHTTNDRYWGDGGVYEWSEDSKEGKNMLGRTLMRLRREVSLAG